MFALPSANTSPYTTKNQFTDVIINFPQCDDRFSTLLFSCRCVYCISIAATSEDSAGMAKERPKEHNILYANENCVCKEHHVYSNPHPSPLKAMGKAVLPANSNLIMPPPSLEEMSDTYWVPVNAVFQKRQVTATLYNSMGYYDHLSVKFPSLRKKPFGEDFPPPRRKITARKKVDSKDEVLYKEISPPQTERGRASTEKFCTCTGAEVTTTTHRPFAGPGRLLSGKLMPTLPNHQESFDNLVIGVKKTSLSPYPDCDMVVGVNKLPYEAPLSNLSTSTKRSTQVSHVTTAITTASTTVKREDSLDGSTAGPIAIRVAGTSSAQANKCSTPKPQSPEDPEPKVNEFNITCENCRRERLLEETAIMDSSVINSSPVELNLASEGESNNRLSSRIHRLSEENLYKPTNVSITFKKPMKLFRVRSVQKKMLQHDHSKQQNDRTTNKSSSNHRHCEMKSGKQRAPKSSRHRSALNKREESAHVEGVFGTQNHHTVSCVLRSRERRKLKLEAVSFNHHMEANNANRTKVRVYLVKTKRNLEDILPKLNSETISQEDKQVPIDIYGE